MPNGIFSDEVLKAKAELKKHFKRADRVEYFSENNDLRDKFIAFKAIVEETVSALNSLRFDFDFDASNLSAPSLIARNALAKPIKLFFLTIQL